MKNNQTLFKDTFQNFILKCVLWTVALCAGCYFLGFVIRAFLNTLLPDVSYRYFRLSYMLVLLVFAWVICMIILIYQLLKKVFSYIAELQNASNQLLNKEIDYIELSPELSDFEIKLNKLKHEAEKNERLARESEQRKNDLIVYLAHDLKTPLTSVVGYLELLKESPDLPLEQRVKYVNITLEKAYRLEELMNEFFEVARFHDIHIVLMKKRLNLKLMLDQIIDEFFPVMNEQNKKIRVVCPEDIVCYADPDKLSRVFSNVIKNAISYSFENTEIKIEASYEQEFITVSIQNEGYTIPKDKLDSIFEKFYRLDDSRGTASGGAGLGLAIAKEIMELHDGTITATSEDHITTFTLRLPREKV